MNARLKTYTLGCKVNQYETEYVRQGLHRIGFADAPRHEPADLCVVNTCTVTAEGDSKSRQIIRRMARENPEARIVVMGCYATRAPQEIHALPGVAEVVTDKRELPDLLSRFGLADVPTGIDGFAGRHRAYLKVQDGCLLRCSYCIIPKVRPSLESRPLEHLVDEARRLIDRGFRELVLTGIHLGHYGVDWNRSQPKERWVRLAHLVDRLARLPGDFRLRLSSIEATEVTRELIDVLRQHPRRIAPHLHVCLQSGSDRVLRRMRRRWGTRMFLDRCRMLGEALDTPALSTDVIVGFPGETEDDFAATCRTCEAAGFSKIHVFPFSPRRGTPAAEMDDQVPVEERRARVGRLMELESRLRRQYHERLVGREVEVLVESCRPVVEIGAAAPRYLCRGTACRYAPTEWWQDAPTETGRLVTVAVTAAEEDRVVGRAGASGAS